VTKTDPLSWSSLCCLPVLACRFGLRQKAGAALLPKPVAVATDREHVAVVEQAVEDRGRDDRIAEDAAPFADRTVARDEQAPALVAARDELEEEMRSLGLEREVAELVDDQKLRLGPVLEPLLEPALELGLAELGHQRVRRHEQHAVAGADHFAAKRDGKMRLADAGRAEEQERV